MTKDEWVKLLSSNVVEFNAKKAETEGNIDLSESELFAINLKDIDLSNIDFTGSNFSESHLININFSHCDLTGTDFARASIAESDFTSASLNGADMSYSSMHYCNFSDADMSGCVLNEANLLDSDFSSSENLNACRFDDSTIWPDSDKLPEEFDSTYSYDLSLLKDEEDESEHSEFGY